MNMKKCLLVSGLALASGFAAAEEVGKVLSSTPVTREVGVQQRQCAPDASPREPCRSVTNFETRTVGYKVVYEYAGKRYQVRMPTDPGQYLRLQVTPVGAMPAQAQQTYPQPYPQQYPQQYLPAPVYIQPAPGYAPRVYGPQVYVQPPAPLVVYPAPYVRPYFAPIGLSLNFGYGSGYGNRHRHWRH